MKQAEHQTVSMTAAAAQANQHLPLPAGPTKVCIQCAKEKTMEEFPRNKNRADGRDNRCKKCTAQVVAARVRRRPVVSEPRVSHKVCTKCEVQKPANEFNRNKVRPDGLCSYCKVCNAQAAAERRKSRTPVCQPTVTHKVCSQCQQDLPAASFHRSKSYNDGLYGKCKACCARALSKRRRPAAASTSDDGDADGDAADDPSYRPSPAAASQPAKSMPLNPQQPQQQQLLGQGQQPRGVYETATSGGDLRRRRLLAAGWLSSSESHSSASRSSASPEGAAGGSGGEAGAGAAALEPWALRKPNRGPARTAKDVELATARRLHARGRLAGATATTAAPSTCWAPQSFQQPQQQAGSFQSLQHLIAQRDLEAVVRMGVGGAEQLEGSDLKGHRSANADAAALLQQGGPAGVQQEGAEPSPQQAQAHQNSLMARLQAVQAQILQRKAGSQDSAPDIQGREPNPAASNLAAVDSVEALQQQAASLWGLAGSPPGAAAALAAGGLTPELLAAMQAQAALLAAGIPAAALPLSPARLLSAAAAPQAPPQAAPWGLPGGTAPAVPQHSGGLPLSLAAADPPLLPRWMLGGPGGAFQPYPGQQLPTTSPPDGATHGATPT